jgi:hypothetical protein
MESRGHRLDASVSADINQSQQNVTENEFSGEGIVNRSERKMFEMLHML